MIWNEMRWDESEVVEKDDEPPNDTTRLNSNW